MKKGAPSVSVDGLREYFTTQRDVIAAYLFGSVARGDPNALSDVDVAALLHPPSDDCATVELSAFAEAMVTYLDAA